MAKKLLVKRRKKILSELTQEIPANGIITVGNDASATIELKDEKIAPEQFVIVCEDGAMTLLARVDGTRINGENLPQGALHNLQFGDEIKVNGFTLTPEAEETNGHQKAKFEPAAAENQPNADAVPPVEKNERSLSDVLENLRSEEKFYFLIREADGENRRVYVEGETMWLGWTRAGECALSAREEELEAPRAQIRKDWSGVVVYPQKKGDIWLNEETLTEPRRLKNDDKIFLVSKDTAKLNLETVVKFHEPTALLILDSILPKELPPPVSLDEAKTAASPTETDEAELIHSSRIPPVRTRPRRNIFGYFTITEIIIMTIGTLITAAVIFLILELY